MANGLITETITHELHSLSKTGITPDASKHFDFLKDYFVQSSSVRTYNDHVVPIKNSYSNISGKLDQIGNLYSFLETTPRKYQRCDNEYQEKPFDNSKKGENRDYMQR